MLTHVGQNIKRHQQKNLYAISPSGTGKTIGLIMSIFHHLKTLNGQELASTQYAIVTSTYDMAAQQFQQNFARKFSIGFISKESNDLERRTNDFNILICTPGEIATKIDEGHRITHIVFDDADTYMPWQKISGLIQKIPNAVYIVVAANEVTGIDKIGHMTAIRIRNFEDDRHHHVEIISNSNTSAMNVKIDILTEILQSVTSICPSKQSLIFCYVRIYPLLGACTSIYLKNKC